MEKVYYLGVDGGGTKTAVVLLNDAGKEIARTVSGPSNYQAVGRKAAEAALGESIRQILASIGLATADITAIGVGMAGADRPGGRQVVHAMLSRIGRFPRVVVTHDAEAALMGGVGRRYGIVLIAGTGAIAYGVNERGEARRADGWGYLLGDEGSAHWIAVQGLRAVMRAYDGRGPTTAVEARILSHLGLPKASQLVPRIYTKDFGVPQLAGLAPLVSQAARDGDTVARSILREAGQRLGETVCAVVRTLNMTAEAFEAVLLGGVLQSSDLVREDVLATLRQTAPRARVIKPRHDPAVGAALLAQQAGE